ncbi:MAG: RNA polymerase sigma factor SigZ [Bacteroidales bacterium]|nr:RNA polymerase sigma factor SigZ [Bacteroidales bacterium]
METDTSKIWVEFSHKIRAFILKRVNDVAIADDILQEVFIKIHTKIALLKDETKLHSWIYQITRNTINDYFRKLNPSSTVVENEIAENIVDDNESMNNIVKGLHDFMDKLPEKYCDVLCKTEFDGLSQLDYAKQNSLSISGAKSRVQRGRKMIKDMLMKCCHFQFDKYGTIIDYHPVSCCCCQQYFEDHPEEK